MRQLQTRNSENSGIAAAPTPCQRMRFSQSKLDRQANKQEASNYRGLSKLGRNSTPRRNKYGAAVQSESSYFCWGLTPAFAPTEATRPKRVEDPRPSPRETFNVQPFPK